MDAWVAVTDISYLMSAAVMCCGSRQCRIGDVCCLPAPAHQPFFSNSLYLTAPEEAYSRNVRASGTLKFGYECVFKIRGQPTNSHQERHNGK